MSLTKEEVNEIFKDVELRFYSYYKYSFTLWAIHEPEIGDPGYMIFASLGGSADDIYRLSLKHSDRRPFKNVEEWDHVVVKKISKGGTTFDYFNYSNPYR